jgi:FdrA protein
MTEWVEVRPGAYRDSVTLLRIGRTLTDRAGVADALTAMATELNRDLLQRLGFEVPGDAGPNDLVVAIRAADKPALAGAQAALEGLLNETPAAAAGATGHGDAPAPRTTGAAARRAAARPDEATLALVSVPGPHAFAEAMDALEAGLNVMVFSDNVPVEQEIALKDEAARRGLLVMGPDCGTAVVGGVGLGFANAVRPGRVGVVAASGTGAQQVMSLLDAAGTGVSHVLGVGGRDLSEAVGGRSTVRALAALDADPATDLILLVSKPPAPEVAEAVRAAARRLSTPVLFGLLGTGGGDGGGTGDGDLTALVERAITALGEGPPPWPHWPAPGPPAPRSGSLAGLFSGGTLCDEAMLIAAERLGPILSNIPLRPEWALAAGDAEPAGRSGPRGHFMIDFGDDRLTTGRAHPMIDGTLRLERLAAVAADPAYAVVLLDVVLGYGADPDPAATLAPAIAAASAGGGDSGGSGPAVVVSLCGTAADPQDRDAQARALSAAGAAVFSSNAAAARHAVALIEGR